MAEEDPEHKGSSPQMDNDAEYSSGEDIRCSDDQQGRGGNRNGQSSYTHRPETSPHPHKTQTKIKGKKSPERPSPISGYRNNRTKKNQYVPETDHQSAQGGYPDYTQGHVRGQGYGNPGEGQGGAMGVFQSGMLGAERGQQDQMQGQVLREAQASKQMVYGVYGNCITMLEELKKPGAAAGWQGGHATVQYLPARSSKQMVYGVYGNCITMLEELENRELQRAGREAMPRSDVYLPDQAKFDDDTIRSKLDTQLILLQCQLTSCHEAIKDEVKDELKESTLNWSSTREDKKLPHGRTDAYAEKLFGLLEIGKTEHPKEFYEAPTIDEEGMKSALGAIMQGQQNKSDLDKAFRQDSNKKATAPKLRKGAGIDKGADRIAETNPEMGRVVDNYRTSLL